MHATAEIHGAEVIGLPGQNLTPTELRVLVGLADGEKPATIARAAGMDSDALLWVERDIQAKLGAKTKPHMIARGFLLQVLIPQALCLALCIATAVEFDHDLFRPRGQRRSRGSTEITRLVRTSPTPGAAGGSRLIS